MPPRLLPIAGKAGATMVCSRAERNIASMMPATIARTAAWSTGAVAGVAPGSSVVAPAGATVTRCSGAARVLMSGFAANWSLPGRFATGLCADQACAEPLLAAYRGRRARRGNFCGQSTMWSSSSWSGTSSSVARTRPRTDTPAACTVSGSPETNGCHQYRSCPWASST